MPKEKEIIKRRQPKGTSGDLNGLVTREPEKPKEGVAYYVFNSSFSESRMKKEVPFMRKVNRVAPDLRIEIKRGTEHLPKNEATRGVITNCEFVTDKHGPVYTAIGRYPGRSNNAAAIELYYLFNGDNLPDTYENPFHTDAGMQDVVWEMGGRFVTTEWLEKAQEIERRKKK